jgi:hypothetical protein
MGKRLHEQHHQYRCNPGERPDERVCIQGLVCDLADLARLSEQIGNAWSLESLAGNWSQNIMNTMEQYLENIQAGKRDQVDNVIAAFKGGYWADSGINDGGLDMQDIRAAANQALYTQLIPKAWSIAYNTYPGIVVQPGACNQTNPFDGVEPLPGKYQGGNENHKWALSNDEAAKTRLCFQDNPDTYYLIKVGYGRPYDHLTGVLPGYDDLDGTKWGGITPAIIVASSVNGYTLNGNKNGYVIPDNPTATDSTGQPGDFIFSGGASTPGLWTVPVCSAANIGATACGNNIAVNPADCPTFPCCNDAFDQGRLPWTGGPP